MVLRRIEEKIPGFEELQLPEVLTDLTMIKRGLVILVGATGTGKSTTLAAMLGYRNENDTGHIISIEDPIEFIHQHKNCIITQREVGIDTASYEVALKNTLRQAPDVIMIGEIRSQDTMKHVLNFADTGQRWRRPSTGGGSVAEYVSGPGHDSQRGCPQPEGADKKIPKPGNADV